MLVILLAIKWTINAESACMYNLYAKQDAFKHFLQKSLENVIFCLKKDQIDFFGY